MVREGRQGARLQKEYPDQAPGESDGQVIELEFLMRSAKKVKRDRFRADLEKALQKGMMTIRGAGVVPNAKRSQAMEKDRVQDKILQLKLRAHQQMSNLGARVYTLMGLKGKNLGMDTHVKDITARLRRYETEIQELERKLRPAGKRIEKRPSPP